MTGNELTLALYSEQGYLLITCSNKKNIGDIIFGTEAGLNERTSFPLRIVSESSGPEFDKQVKLAERLSPGCNGPVRWPYFYRVEAAD